MNYRGSYRRLIGNSISAMLSAVEIYNKPRIEYRDEVFSILLMNSWELLLKAVVSRSRGSLYYPKVRNQPYKTLSWGDALRKAANSQHWPKEFALEAMRANLEAIALYRDNSVHFYNDKDFGVLIYSLAQTSVNNYRDILLRVFQRDLREEVSWRLLPLGTRAVADPVEFLKSKKVEGSKQNRAVRDYLQVISDQKEELAKNGVDDSRFLTLFKVNFQSAKKITDADIVVGVEAATGDDSERIVERKIDPNKTHPYRMNDILKKLKTPTTSHRFQAVTRMHGLREDPRYCWRDETGMVTRWSGDTIRYLNDLTSEELDAAVENYSRHLRERKRVEAIQDGN